MSEDLPEVAIVQDGDATIVVLPSGQSAVYTDGAVEHIVNGVLVVEQTPGPQGERGIVGPEGPPGQQGETGPVGLTGLMGATGKQGKPGPAGIQGKQGRDGPQGRTGDTGRTGERGPEGPIGKQGETGSQGLPGFPGQDAVGIQGPAGRSAFDLARATGFTGGLSAWLTSLKGDRGERGPEGKRGERGLKGERGDRGEKGSQGLRGPAGGEGRFGSNGVNGRDGSAWYTGIGVPPGALGNDGDFYLDSVSGDYYEKEAGVWVLKGNLQGPGSGGSSDLYIGLAAEDIDDGDFCYVTSISEIALADASVTGNQCIGYVLLGGPAGTPVTIYFEGVNTAVVGWTPGARYYLSAAIPGKGTDIPVRGAGRFDQYLGRAITATKMTFEADDIVRLRS